MKYHKIQSMFKRDPETKFKTFLDEFSMPEFEYLKDNEWNWTEKVDGTNVRVMWDGRQVTVGGRTDNAQLHTGLFAELHNQFPPEAMAKVFGDSSVILFGEGFGEKIQAGGNYRKGQGFVLFDVWDAIWLNRWSVMDIGHQLGCDIVPELGSGSLADAVECVKKRPQSDWGDFTAEGIVLRPKVELLTRRGERIITKLKVKDFPELGELG